MTRGDRAGLAFRLRQTGRTLLIMLATSGAAFLLAPARGEVSGALVFVLGIIWAGSSLGLGQALIASSLSFLLYNFYFAEPVLTFRVDTASDITPLVIFNASAVVAGILSGRLRDEAEAAASANRALTALLGLSRALQSALTFDDIRAALAAADGPSIHIREEEEATAREAAGEPVATLLPVGPTAQQTFRMQIGQRAWTIAIDTPGDDQDGNAAGAMALANLVSLALERASLSERIAEAEAATRMEDLKSSLLSSVSHDFRTPLGIISASASGLLDYGDRLDLPIAGSFLRTILAESERLNRYTANLLELTRIEAGQPPPGQIVEVADIVGACMRQVRPRAGSRIIERTDDRDGLVLADPTLFELALGNVLENALLYSEDGTAIRISIATGAGRCTIDVADEGCGIPAGEADRIFDRFYRVDRTRHLQRGTGLGLAIAKGFVTAFGGTIAATSPGTNGRGTTIRIDLPLAPGED